jgi:hypothetical protein
MLFQLNTIEVNEPNDLGTGGKPTTAHQRTPDSMKLNEVLTLVQANACVHWVTNGDWNMHDLLIGLLNITGAADVHLSSYGFSDYPARIIADLKERKIIKKLYCLIDNRIDKRSASALAIIKNMADGFLMLNTHAKVTVIEGGTNNLVVIGSANYTTNKRYEAGVVINVPEAVSFHKTWMQNELNKSKVK